ncbi:DUF378 domain-containing protein [Candidatus Pacearchaeota archaeon]|nr:DUF378 domain-containing protein [Candidatus Pacearchaeota archaeon]
MNTLDNVVKTLVIVGAINWGLHAYNLNIVDKVLGEGSVAAMVVYVLVGLAGLKMLYDTFN